MKKLIIAVVALCVAASTASAQVTGDAGKKWAEGVSADDQKIASDLFKEGNALLRDANYNDALVKYQDAVAHWKHPAIYFNMVLALLAVGDAMEIYDALQGAMKYGIDGLGGSKEEYESAQTYLKLVEQQLIHITVKCEEDGAKVFVDGKATADCPGDKEILLKAGEHTFAVSKEGFETTTVDKVYPGGQTETVDLKIYRLSDLTRYKRKFAPWVSYAVIGGGVAIAGVGGLLHASASSDIKSFDAAVEQCGGCVPSSDLTSKRDGASTKQTIGFVGYGVGAAAVVAGVTLMILNRPQPYRIDAESQEPKGVVVVPVVDRKGVGVAASLHF